MNCERGTLVGIFCFALVLAESQRTTSQEKRVNEYFPIGKGAKWEYRVDFPTTASIPYQPRYEIPAGIICTSFHCGMGSWNAGQITFSMLVNDVVQDTSSTSSTWKLALSRQGLRFYFYLTDTVANQSQIRLKLQGENADFDLITIVSTRTPPNWRIVRSLARLAPSDLNAKFNVSVPAGEFIDCVKSVVKIEGDATYVPSGTWPVEVLLAQNVGIVKATGKNPSGTTLYTLELTKFTPSPNVKVDEKEVPVPKSFVLAQNYPNPFNASTSIQYVLRKSEQVDVIIYNSSGELVRTLLRRNQPAGTYVVRWDGTNDQGKTVPSGVYFYQLKVKRGIQETKRMLLLK